jgi:hypothetical protein
MLTGKASLYRASTAIASQTLTSTDVNGAIIDTQGFNSLFFVINVGANGGTLNGSNKLDVKLQHGDVSDLSDATVVTDIGMSGGFTIDSNGIFATIDAAGEAGAVYKVSYTGIKRYVRLVADITGTISLPVGAVALSGDGLVTQA